jgi:transcriptional regulator with XRE-family HTH domain
MSWAAIAQIESGRRREVRLNSLLSLANALGVSVDYLVGGEATVSPKLLNHRALLYASDEEYLASATPFLADGVERAECVVAVVASRAGGLLREALGDDARQVEFWDSAEWYGSPKRALHDYRSLVAARFGAGAHWVRVLGEPVWAGRSESEIIEWTRYESLINLSLAAAPASILCPYDSRHVPAAVLTRARQAHPELLADGAATASHEFLDPEDYLLAVS